MINNSLAKERVFYRLNERFGSNRTGDIIFSTRIFRTLHTNKHFVSDLPTRVETQNISLNKKITKHERRAKQTLINNSLAKERVFYRLNERFASNRNADIIFSARIFRTLHTNKHFVSDLPTRVETQNISLKNNQLNVSNAPKKLRLTILWLKKEYFAV